MLFKNYSKNPLCAFISLLKHLFLKRKKYTVLIKSAAANRFSLFQESNTKIVIIAFKKNIDEQNFALKLQ